MFHFSHFELYVCMYMYIYMYIYIYVVFLGSMFDSGGRSVFFTHCAVHVDAC